MNLAIDIIDTLNDSLVLSREKAVGSSLILNWKGGDYKDDIYVLGSSLDFEMLGMSCLDGQYSDLFTGDETRFRVKLYTPDAILWEGFILPDAYSEPYVDGPIPVKFRATDGLGRLKGKYLPDDFYEEEKSVIAILAKCLELTGLLLNFRFAPAIENAVQKDYDKIYIDTSLFKNGERKDDAHAILDSLLRSMFCTLFQADNYYNIEGFNVRNFRVYDTKVYSPDGELIEEQKVTRRLKNLTATKPTNVTIQPPYGKIQVTHKREPVTLPDTIATEKNDGWVQMENVNEPIYATDWFSNIGTEADTGEDMTVGIDGYRQGNGDGWVSLTRKIYVKKGQKLRLKMGFQLVLISYRMFESDAVKFAIEQGNWVNPFFMSVRLHYPGSVVENVPSIILRNFFPDGDATIGRYFELDFDENGKVEKEVQFIPNRSGELDIRIHPAFDSEVKSTFIDRVNITEFKLEEVGFEEEYISEITQDGYSRKKEEEIDFADDAAGLSKSFRLQKLKVPGKFNVKEIPVSRLFPFDGYWWAYVDLKGANLIKDNIKTVHSLGDPIEILDVVYNYNNSQEHAVKLASAMQGVMNPETSQMEYSFTVYIHEYNSVNEDRDYWEQWSDSRFKVEKKRYCDVGSSMLDLMSRSPLIKLDYQVIGNVKINDFLQFDFQGGKQFMLTSCKWDLDKGLTNTTAIQAFYGVEAGKNIPPIVEAEDIYLDEATTGHGLFSAGFDPDGWIVSYFWEELTNNGAIISNPYQSRTNAFNLTEDYYEFQVTVTDNDGATASDIVRMYRHKTTNIKATIVTQEHPHELEAYYEWILEVEPEIPEGSALNIQGALIGEGKGAVRATVVVYQNGTEKRRMSGRNRGENDELLVFDKKGFSLNYLPGDQILFTIHLDLDGREDINEVKAGFNVELVEFVDGYGQITGIPITKTHVLT